MPPFEYPVDPLDRKHGPEGYREHASFRPWLRDEFTFRCVYCLTREQWGRVIREFDIDHFIPQAIDPSQAFTYKNLVYSCARCNAIKSSVKVSDPTDALISSNLRVDPDGSLKGYSSAAEELILKLDLNSPEMVSWRLLWTRIIELACDYDAKLYRRLLGFPEDLPDLSQLRPPSGNSRPDGIAKSYFSQAARGELPPIY
jgi:hypothetical protein